jgi:hypothetical protein
VSVTITPMANSQSSLFGNGGSMTACQSFGNGPGVKQ